MVNVLLQMAAILQEDFKLSSHIQFKIEDKFFNCPAIAKENDFEVKSLSHTYKVSFDESVNPVEKINHMMAQNLSLIHI